MKAVVKIVSIIGVVLLWNGCATNSIEREKYPFDLNKQHIVKYYKDSYYYRPNNAWSYKLNKSSVHLSAHINNTASSGQLTCKDNDIWFISVNNKAEEYKVRYRYFISLGKSELNKMKEDPTFIPRKDSKEFAELTEIDTRLVRQGLIGCSSVIPKEQIERIIPMSDIAVIPAS